MYHVLHGVQIPHGKGQFFGEKGRFIVKYRDTRRCAKTAEQLEMPFGLWVWMGQRNHLLDGGPEVLMDVAMATNFATKIAITGFV